MIKLTRIDDRFVHGQVSFTWVPALDINCILVANDKIASDDFQKMAMGLAKPPSAKLLVLSVKDSASFLNDAKSKNAKVLLLVNSINDVLRICSEVPEIQSINFGGIRSKEGSKLISKAIAVTEGEIVVLKQLIARGIELEIRQVPTDKKQLVKNLID